MWDYITSDIRKAYQLFNGDFGLDYRQQSQNAFQKGNYLQGLLLGTDGIIEATFDVGMVPVAAITSKIDSFCQENLGLGLAEMAITLQSNQLTVPAGAALYHFSNWAKITASGTGSAFVTTATNVGVETVNQAAGLVGITPQSLSTKEINKLRRSAVKEAWKQEKEMVINGSRGTVRWTKAEKMELLKTGKVKGYEGHHINSVQYCIDNECTDLIGNPNNIMFMKRRDHLQNGHNGNWQNYSTGDLLNRGEY